MINLVELFSGIGSQLKAVKNLGIEFNVLATVEWDIHAIIAYDLLHNGPQNNFKFKYNREQILLELSKYNFSSNGKTPFYEGKLERLKDDLLKSLYIAVKRTKNLVNILDVNHNNLPLGIDVMTYSFPCQDLSISGNWHGYNGGIDRHTNNRSNMLWQVERILQDLEKNDQRLPNFLLMENVNNILSKSHIENFNEWKNELERLGYINQVYTLNSNNFNSPQKRVRTYMISVLCDDENQKELVKYYFEKNNLSEMIYPQNYQMDDYLKLDYKNKIYLKEALINQPNNTISRKKIHDNNVHIFDGKQIAVESITTITTKQDRHPNSGVILVDFDNNKSNFRTLTPRECFLFMGFSEKDYNRILDGNFYINNRHDFFTNENLMRLAGNSIVVEVLEAIFVQINEINTRIFNRKF